MCDLLGQEFPLFRILKTLIQHGSLSDDVIESIADMLRISIKQTRNKLQQIKLQKAVEYVHHLKEQHEEQSMLDEILKNI